jgi:thiol-disulfide isomerase/thioredoxin
VFAKIRTCKEIDAMKRVLLATLLFGIGVLASMGIYSSVAHAAPPAQNMESVAIYFFWGDGCPHCAAAKPFLAALEQKYPSVTVRAYEVWNDDANRDLFIKMAAKYGFEPTAVPTIFIGDRYWVGYTEEPYAREIEDAAKSCVLGGCPDAGAGVIAPLQAPTPASPPLAPTPVAIAAGADVTAQAAIIAPASSVIAAPFLGEIDLGAQSLLLSTALIAFVDGVNPCSLWVLSVLLALTIHTGSRRKVFIIGAVFLTVTSLVYALFIAGLFTMFTVLDWVPWIQIVVALVALFFALINIKDYFWYKEGISLTIADEQKPGLYRNMRRVLQAGDSMPALIGAAIVMSAGASLVEFSCTAGFPMLWSNLLSAQGVTTVTFILLLILYMAIYQLDEIIIFTGAVVGLRASKLEEKQGRILKLISGTLMLVLAIIMLVNPSLMSSLSATFWVFVIAFGAALLVLLVHRKLLPALGIYIGTELRPAGKKHSHKSQHGKAAR